jgi:hypothetical protein
MADSKWPMAKKSETDSPILVRTIGYLPSAISHLLLLDIRPYAVR